MHARILLLLLLLLPAHGFTQTAQVENLLIITLDGMRWQEVFGGMDSVLASHKKFNQGEKEAIYATYWDHNPQVRRSKLMPFLWSEIAENGQIYGNRTLGSQVDNANPYWFSYPGYSEIFCGYVDTAVNSNGYKPNPNTTVLEFIHAQQGFQGKVAAFGAWDAFDRILNSERSGIPVVCGEENCGGSNPTEAERMINALKSQTRSPFGSAEHLDVFTHQAAFEYLKNNAPRVLYISYGETDEWAHHAHYRDYLASAHQTDAWIQELWTWLQNDPRYREKTALFITVDHGRGDVNKKEWTSHGRGVADSHETWFAAMGPGIEPKGEIKSAPSIVQTMYAQTFAALLGLNYTCEHPVAESLGALLSGK